jgi:plasmid maintenance system antidote protein VapI
MTELHHEIVKLKRAFERQRPRISKNELARRAGIHRTTVYTVFGEKNGTTPDVVGKLAAALGLEFNYKVRVGTRMRKTA